MSDKVYTGNAPRVAQINTITPGTVLIGSTFTITINGKNVTYTATVATVANVTAGLVALLNSVTSPPPAEFQEITWTDQTTFVKGVNIISGVPFVQTSSATGVGATNATVTTVANSGPHDASLAKNWSGNTVPVDGDYLYFDNLDVDVLYGIDYLTKAVLANGVHLISVSSAFSGSFGLPKYNPNGYLEYRPTYFQLPMFDSSSYFRYAGTGSRAKFDLAGNDIANIVVNNTGTSDDLLAPLIIKDVENGSFIDVYKGRVQVAIEPGDGVTFDTVVIGFLTDPVNDAYLEFGSLSVTSVKATGGILHIPSAPLLVMTGEAVVYATGAVLNIYNYGNTLYYLGAGLTISNYIGGADSTINFNQLLAPRTVDAIILYAGSTVIDSSGTVTFTNGYELAGCTMADVTVDLGPGRTIVPTPI